MSNHSGVNNNEITDNGNNTTKLRQNSLVYTKVEDLLICKAFMIASLDLIAGGFTEDARSQHSSTNNIFGCSETADRSRQTIVQ
jgi:hypothetical protein